MFDPEEEEEGIVCECIDPEGHLHVVWVEPLDDAVKDIIMWAKPIAMQFQENKDFVDCFTYSVYECCKSIEQKLKDKYE